MTRDEQLDRFVVESWRIEGKAIRGPDLERMRIVHKDFLRIASPPLEALVQAALDFTDGEGRLRNKIGMDVTVGWNRYKPPSGGENVEKAVKSYLQEAANHTRWTRTMAYHYHIHYETLHPFMDGNGRTGRLLWAWMMQRVDPRGDFWELGFLHSFYYQSLEASR